MLHSFYHINGVSGVVAVGAFIVALAFKHTVIAIHNVPLFVYKLHHPMIPWTKRLAAGRRLKDWLKLFDVFEKPKHVGNPFPKGFCPLHYFSNKTKFNGHLNSFQVGVVSSAWFEPGGALNCSLKLFGLAMRKGVGRKGSLSAVQVKL